MSTYLVTGGAGFIGSHLCETLLSQGHQVRILDDLSTGKLDNLVVSSDFTLGSVTNRDLVRKVMDGVDGVFHLAAIASVEKGNLEWVDSHKANLTGAIVIFEEAARILRTALKVVPVVYASSAAVYGECDTVPITEQAACRPLSAYGADKLGCELHARVASHVHNVPTVGLRFFNVYGPRQDPKSPYSGVISIFCDRLMRGHPITINGDGKQTRDFVFVSDVVLALMGAMALRPSQALVFNVCTGMPTQVHELAQVIGELSQRTPDIRIGPARAGEIQHSVGETDSALRRAIELPAPQKIRFGLEQVLNWLSTSAA